MTQPKNPIQAQAQIAVALAGAQQAAQQFFQQRSQSYGSVQELPAEIKAVLDFPVEHFKKLAETATPTPGVEPLTHVAFVLDKSSSMKHGIDVTMEGFNKQVDVVCEGAKEAGKTLFTQAQFSDQVTLTDVATSLDHMAKLTPATYVPCGMTALYDGLGDTIAALLRTPHINEPTTATLVTVFTDGDENASRRYTPSVLSELIKRLEATGRWTFALVGPRTSVTDLAKLLSVPVSNVQGYDPSSIQGRASAFSAMANASTTYMSMRAVGATQAHSLYEVHEPENKV